MKRKFAAVVLGLTLAITPAAAFAEENAGVTEQTEQQSSVSDEEAKQQSSGSGEEAEQQSSAPDKESEEAEKENRLTGIVKEIGEDSITVELKEDILNGELEDDTEKAAVDGMDDTEAGESNDEAESSADGSEVSAEAELMEDEDIENAELAEDDDASENAEIAVGDDASESNGTSDDEKVPAEERIITITEDTKFYYVPNTEDGRLLMKEYSEDSDELSELQTIEVTDILEEDIVSITLDEDGNASMVLVMFANEEEDELSSESEETEILLEDTEEGVEITIE